MNKMSINSSGTIFNANKINGSIYACYGFQQSFRIKVK